MSSDKFLLKDTNSLVWGILYSVLFISVIVTIYGTILLNLKYVKNNEPTCPIPPESDDLQEETNDPNRENGIMALKVGLFMIILALSFCIVFLIQTSAIQVMPISFVVLTIAMAPIIFMYFQTVYYSDRIIKGNISDEYNKYMKLFITVMILNVALPVQNYIQKLRKLGTPLDNSKTDDGGALKSAAGAGPYLILTSLVLFMVSLIVHVILKFFTTDG